MERRRFLASRPDGAMRKLVELNFAAGMLLKYNGQRQENGRYRRFIAALLRIKIAEPSMRSAACT